MSKLPHLLLALLLASPLANAMKGVFWQPQLRDNPISEASWQSLMHNLRQQGFDTLILQWTRYGDAFTQEHDRTLLQQKAAAAQRAGLKVIVGLNADPDFFGRQKQSAAAQESYLSRLRALDIQQARLWLDTAGVKPDGWYLSAEIDDLNWRSDAARQPMLTWLADTRRALGAISDRPVYISSFFAGNMAPQGYSQLVGQMKAAGVNVWVQDGTGVGKLTDAQRALYLDAAAGCASASPARGVVYEVFEAGSGKTFSARPMPDARINALLKQASPCGKDSLYFSLRYLPVARGVMSHE
ncbi:DUF4434 family protein [[Enterobacter] lignolyticus]|uniref:DUF4434 domain-containing protein n=1 Tax=[Enterobacter] lignolyticus TaxID=1334193 RepID=A0A806X6F4_9ENTR|nr:DUF4434 family protein [[Enterobacter] lignolyticus]ALR75083.1 hypothetical protein AO703_01745 [[Enterobacter] lignolyticus]